MHAPILGLDIGGTKTAVVLGDRSGSIQVRTAFATRTERGFDATFAELCEHIAQVQGRATAAGRSAEAISVSIGGPLARIIHGGVEKAAFVGSNWF
jgi:glucokinase